VSLLAGGAGLLADLAVMAWGALAGGFDTVDDLLLLVLDACLVYAIVTLVRLFASRSPEPVGRPRVAERGRRHDGGGGDRDDGARYSSVRRARAVGRRGPTPVPEDPHPPRNSRRPAARPRRRHHSPWTPTCGACLAT